MRPQSALCLLLLLALMGCGGTPTANTAGPPDTGSLPPPLTLDCTAGHPACPELVIAGDVAAQGPFRGFADPSIRRDPRTGRIWLAYSWPHLSGGAPVVDIHLAHSDDQGQTWQYDRPLYAAQAEISPATGRPGFSSHEVVTLWPDARGTAMTWYAAHLAYHVEPGRGLYGEPTSFRFRITSAASPLQLVNAPDVTLGFGVTDPRWDPDVNLSSLSPELSRCALWNEPALLSRNGTLYLYAECLAFTTGGETDDRASFYAIFSTSASSPDPRDWRWSFRGRFAGHAEALELDQHNMWVELDPAQRVDGSLLTLVTPSDFNPVIDWDAHAGCRALDLTDADPPALARMADGRLKLRASVTASDLAPYGPGACGYDPSSVTGILFVRKTGNSPSGGVWTLHRTGLRP